MLRTQDKRVFLGQTLGDIFPSYRAQEFEAIGAPPTTSGGTSITASASANTKGTWTELGTSSIDADGFYVAMTPTTGNRDYLFDIGIGAAGSEVTLVENILICSGSIGAAAESSSFFIPLAIAAGTRIAVRSQANVGSAGLSGFVIIAKGEEILRLQKRRATTYGANTADSGGTSVDPGATVNTDGAWSELSASVNRIEGLLICSGNQANALRENASYRFDLGRGAAGSEAVVIPSNFIRNTQAGDVFFPLHIERQCFIPAGSRLAARGRCSLNDATDRLFDLVVVGFD